MSRTPAFSSFFGIGSMPHSGMPGPPLGPAFLSTRTWSGVTSRSSRSISRRHVVVVLERQRRAAMLAGSRGSAADGFITQPRGARLPVSTAVAPAVDTDR